MTLLYISNAWLRTWLNRQNLLRGSKLGEKKNNCFSFPNCFPWYISDLFSCSNIYNHTDFKGCPYRLECMLFSLITEDDKDKVRVQLKFDLKSVESSASD